MSLIGRMRSGIDSPFMVTVLVVIVITFVFWGVGKQGGNTTAVVARVNGERITSTRFNHLMRRALQSQRGAMSEAQESALRNQVLDQLIFTTLLRQEAERLDLHVSDEEVAQAIKELDVFHDENGKFSKEIYTSTIKRMGLTREQLEAEFREQLLIQKLLGLVDLGVQVTPVAVREAWEDQNTQLDLQVVRIELETVRAGIQPTDEEIDAYVEEHREELQRAYEELRESRFRTPARARLRTVLLRTDIPGVSEDAVKARIEEIRKQALEGADFAELARTWSEDLSAAEGGLLGEQTEDQLDPVVARAVEATPVGGISEVVHTARGYQFLLVEDKTEAVETPFEEAARILAREAIQDERTPERARELAQALHDGWTGDEPPADLLAGFEVQTLDDVAPATPRHPALGAATPEVLLAAREAEPGTVLPRVFEDDDALIVARLVSRTEPDEERFTEERDALRTLLTVTERRFYRQAWQDDLLRRATIERYL